MSTSPLDPQDIRAAAEVHRELGPEYNDAVVAAFIDRVDRAVEARVQARLAAERPRQPAARRGRRALLKGAVIGVCAGALIAGVSIAQTHGGLAHNVQVRAVPNGQLGPPPPLAPPGPGH
jgi:anti-sigma factor RsiW